MFLNARPFLCWDYYSNVQQVDPAMLAFDIDNTGRHVKGLSTGDPSVRPGKMSNARMALLPRFDMHPNGGLMNMGARTPGHRVISHRDCLRGPRGIAHRRLDRPSSAGPLRRGTFFILPPVLLVYTEDHYTKTIVVTNNSAPSSLQAPCS